MTVFSIADDSGHGGRKSRVTNVESRATVVAGEISLMRVVQAKPVFILQILVAKDFVLLVKYFVCAYFVSNTLYWNIRKLVIVGKLLTRIVHFIIFKS